MSVMKTAAFNRTCLKFPLAVIIVKNYSLANNVIIKQMDAILRDGKIIDSKGRAISFQNCFFAFVEEEKASRSVLSFRV